MVNLPQYTRIAFLHISYNDAHTVDTNNSNNICAMDVVCKELLFHLSRQHHDLCSKK